MGKITINGKDLTKGLKIGDKNVKKITINGKDLTFGKPLPKLRAVLFDKNTNQTGVYEMDGTISKGTEGAYSLSENGNYLISKDSETFELRDKSNNVLKLFSKTWPITISKSGNFYWYLPKSNLTGNTTLYDGKGNIIKTMNSMNADSASFDDKDLSIIKPNTVLMYLIDKKGNITKTINKSYDVCSLSTDLKLTGTIASIFPGFIYDYGNNNIAINHTDESFIDIYAMYDKTISVNKTKKEAYLMYANIDLVNRTFKYMSGVTKFTRKGFFGVDNKIYDINGSEVYTLPDNLIFKNNLDSYNELLLVDIV